MWVVMNTNVSGDRDIKYDKGLNYDPIVNDSPHPHASVMLGFLNENLELR